MFIITETRAKSDGGNRHSVVMDDDGKPVEFDTEDKANSYREILDTECFRQGDLNRPLFRVMKTKEKMVSRS